MLHARANYQVSASICWTKSDPYKQMFSWLYRQSAIINRLPVFLLFLPWIFLFNWILVHYIIFAVNDKVITACILFVTACCYKATAHHYEVTACHCNVTACCYKVTVYGNKMTACYHDVTACCNEVTVHCDEIIACYHDVTACYDEVTAYHN